MMEILSLADMSIKRGEIPIILGDFNASPDICPTSYTTLLRGGWEDTFVSAQQTSMNYSSDCSGQTETTWWTWDPKNALNVAGLHASCHGLRCDHVFLPPAECRGSLEQFRVYEACILLNQPRVLVNTNWLHSCLSPLLRLGWSSPLLLTLSDHYALRVEIRKTPFCVTNPPRYLESVPI